MMGPNNIAAKPSTMPTADLSTPAQSKASSTIMNNKIKVNYGDDAKVNHLSLALQNVKSSQNVALEHVESAKSKIIL